MTQNSIIKLVGALIVFFHTNLLYSQIDGNERRYVRIGSLQSYFTAYGSERAWNGSYYEGLDWPADYPKQDNAVIKRAWIAARDFTDENGTDWSHWGTYIYNSNVDISLFPVELKQTAKFSHPAIYVDGNNTTSQYTDDIDEINPDQIPDRIVTNVVNTSLGLTMTRRISAFSQQYHDNYFIKEFILTNTGNVDYDEEIELSDSLHGVRIGWGTRYSVCRDGANSMADGSQKWGKHSWVTKRGEDYAAHVGETFTEADPIHQWLRAGFSYLGQNENSSYSTIGAPYITENGRLASPQHIGTAILHVPISASDSTDDPNQPTALGWHAGDTYPSGDMAAIYNFLSGVPYGTGMGGTNRMDETYMTDYWVDPYTIHNDGGGTNLWICYGPFDLAHGDSIVIVEAEGVNGLNRQMCEEIGARWKQAHQDPSDLGPFELPDGSTTDDEDVFKNSWVYTGKDSIMLTFGRAKRNYDLNYSIAQPPLPPQIFEIVSGTDRITLAWVPSPSESNIDFAGYKIYRALSIPDTIYEEICTLQTGTRSYADTSVVTGSNYYYSIVSINDGSNNVTGVANPTGPLYSSKFLTRTNQPAYLRDHPVITADVYVSPDGNDGNSGLSTDSALRTITTAIIRIAPTGLNPRTIFLSDGTYSPSTNGESYPLNWKSYLSLAGAAEELTILDAENQGGVIYCIDDTDFMIEDLTLRNGSADLGGALYCESSNPILMNVTIEGNSATESGGGIYSSSSTIGLTNVTIKDNSATLSGGGIYLFTDSHLNFDSTNTCNLFNNTASIGFDISINSVLSDFNFDIVLDTFTVMQPTDYQAYPIHNFTFDIMNSKVEQLNADLYVDSNGDDSNGGLSSSDPMRTITNALIKIQSDYLSPHTIHLAEGVYAPSTNGESYPLYGNSYLSISGAAPDSTVLDAEGTTSIFNCLGDSIFTIQNLSIINGGGSGIYCMASNPILSNLKISNNFAASGGGIYCWRNSHVQIINSTISGNASSIQGGGIYCRGDSYWGFAQIDLSNTTITSNSAGYSGGGISLIGDLANANFDSVNRSNVFLNEAGNFGNDLFSGYSAPISEVIVDTFTVLYPIDEYAYPLDNFTFDILNYKIEQAEADLYVNPNGSNENSGLSVAEPLLTITLALELIYADSSRPHTIHLADGTYSPSTNGESFPLNCKSYVSIEGVDEETTILDAEGLARVIHCENVNDINIENLTIKNGVADYGGGIYCSNSIPNISNVRIIDNIASSNGGGMYFESAPSLLSDMVITGNIATQYGGGIYCGDSSNLVINNIILNNNKANSRGGGLYSTGSNPILVNTIISGDSSRYGGGIYCIQSIPNLIRVTINGNTALNNGGGVFCSESNPLFTNVTITGNTALSIGGGLHCVQNSSLRLINTILWNDMPQEIYPPSCDANVSYSNVQGSWTGEGNIDNEPLFVDPVNGDFNLQVGSPCIDAGTNFFVWEGDTLVNLSPDEYDGNAPDMGAYESPYTVAINDEQILPDKFTLYQNYPNPFNPITTIRYDLPEATNVQVVIYDLLGRQVIILVNEYQAAGYRSAMWNCRNSSDQTVSAGIYFYAIKVEKYTGFKKMVLLK